MRLMLLVSCVVVLITNVVADATTPASLSDSAIRQQILGSWTMSPESPDYGVWSGTFVETFRSDGTYSGYLYKGQDCRSVSHIADAKWQVKNGVLISTYQDGSTDNDDVVSINGDKMSLLSSQLGVIVLRTRTNACPEPSA